MKAIDLFAGLGGFSTGAALAGVNVIWAANHWPAAVQWHARNNPDAQHSCQDLNQADWSQAPAHDILLASPCCQGHSPARGRDNGNPRHDASRSTAWAVVEAAEFHRPEAVIVENVPHIMNWVLYGTWIAAFEALGYKCSPHLVDCADLDVPQNRVRLFLVCTRSREPLRLQLPPQDHVPASSFVDFSQGSWSSIERPGRAAATLARVRNGRQRHGDRFLMPYYGSGSGTNGRSLDRPIGTITTRARWAVVNGSRMRMLTADEAFAAQTFPHDTFRPKNERLAMHLAGNAVPPLAAKSVINAVAQSL